ncbi:hypothetical protein [Bacillus alveayuensis]|jgi:methylmalonyl-CoA decarboxylase subunit alpha|nr:hypothetical protein [Bacillus alveayuensis]
MVEIAIGEKTTMEEMGSARMHCADVLVYSEKEAIEIEYIP